MFLAKPAGLEIVDLSTVGSGFESRLGFFSPIEKLMFQSTLHGRN